MDPAKNPAGLLQLLGVIRIERLDLTIPREHSKLIFSFVSVFPKNPYAIFEAGAKIIHDDCGPLLVEAAIFRLHDGVIRRKEVPEILRNGLLLRVAWARRQLSRLRVLTNHAIRILGEVIHLMLQALGLLLQVSYARGVATGGFRHNVLD